MVIHNRKTSDSDRKISREQFQSFLDPIFAIDAIIGVFL